MTELEQHLLTAFEHLQSEHEKQQKLFLDACKDLESMFESTLLENEQIKRQVIALSEQVLNLSTQLSRLEKLYSEKRDR